MFGQKRKVEEANRYFMRQMEKVFVDNGELALETESFSQYLAHKYPTNCYFYSGYSIMGLMNSDLLVRGTIVLPEDVVFQNGGYGHGWVEFWYKNKEYVFDPRLPSMTQKNAWYAKYKPNITCKITKKQLLDRFLNSETATYMDDDSYQICSLFDPTDKTFTTNIYSRARIYIHAGSVLLFVGYQQAPQC